MRHVIHLQRRALFLGLGLILACSAGHACDNPVYRYALENWAPNAFELLLVTDGPLSAEEQALWKQMQHSTAQSAAPNWQIKQIARDQLTSALGPMAASLENRSGTLLALISPEGPLGKRLVWSGPATEQSWQLLLDSPARRELGQRLIAGEAVVWVLLETADQAGNDKVRELLDSFLPEYVEALVAAEATAPKPANPEPELLANPDKKPVDKSVFWPPRFSTLSISAADPREEVLAALLRQSLPGELADEPVVFAVFGQGRVLGGLPLSRLNAQLLRTACDFLTGACSCEVKERNPGDDLLMAAAWQTVPKASAPAGIVSLLELEPSTPATTDIPPATPSDDTPPPLETQQLPALDNPLPVDAPEPTTADASTTTAPMPPDQSTHKPALDAAPRTQAPPPQPSGVLRGSPILIFGGILAAIILVALFGMRR